MSLLLGDFVHEALKKVGVTEDRVKAVTTWLHIPGCKCKERRKKLNDMHNWAVKVLTGKVSPESATKELEDMSYIQEDAKIDPNTGKYNAK